MATIGVQMYNLFDKIQQQGMFEVLRQVDDLGFKAVEVTRVALDDPTIADLQRARQELGTEVAALTVTLGGKWGSNNDLDNDYEHVVETAHGLGTRFLRIGMMPVEAMVSRPAVEEWAAACEQKATQLRNEGLTLCYHNHHVDLAKVDGERIFDVVRRTAPDLMFEVDLFWVQRGGMAPIDMLTAYTGACKLVHLKDYRVVPLPVAAAKAREDGDMETFRKAWNDIVQFGELGTGNINWPEVIPAAVDAGGEFLFIEQDDTYGRDPLDSLRDSRDYLHSIGYADNEA